MHSIEPFYNWQNIYVSEEDESSPFYGRVYSEFEFTHAVYNYLIHPQWDEFGSATLYLKIIFADYELGFAVIEFIGEWNDCLYNDIMYLKRDVIDLLIQKGIRKFMLIGENVMNFHFSDESYYQEWYEDIEGGWIIGINFRQHVIDEFRKCLINHYILFNSPENEINWRRHDPLNLFEIIEEMIPLRLKS